MSAGTRRILLVEDDLAIREALGEVLTELGYEPVTAPDGQQGLRLAAAEPEPCTILLDWRMPVVDGRTFLQRLRELPRGTEFPVILSTADRGAASIEEADRQIVGVLSKPFDLGELTALLQRAMPARG